MHALVFNEQLDFFDNVSVPTPAKNEALIKIQYAGICNTDLEITRGYMGFNGIPGHEFVGIVEQSNDQNIIGKRVVGDINIGCGKCTLCIAGLSNHCPVRSVLGILHKNGAFAEYVTLPVRNLHIVPDSVSDKEAVFTEPLAAAFEILHQINIMKSQRVCVLGDGKLGLLVSQVMSTTGCDLVVVGKHAQKLLLLQNMNIRTETAASFDENNFDVVIECTGSSSGIEKALHIVRPGGKIVLKTTAAVQGKIDLNHIVINEISLIGSRCGPFPDALKAIEAGCFNLLPLISAEYSLKDGLKAMDHASKRGVIKIILKAT